MEMKKFFFILFVFTGIPGAFFVSNVIISVSHVPYSEYGSLVLVDKHGTLITEKGEEGGYMIPYSGSLTLPLIRDIIAIEDARFYEHHGINILAKLSAIRENTQAGFIVRGGSTLTEQYLKNAYFSGKERTIVQKARESIGALYLENSKNKDEVLRNYLDSIYFGNRIYGLGSALASYFPGKEPENLTKDEILDIITRIHSPNISEKNLKSALEYRERMASRLAIPPGKSGLMEHTRTTYMDSFPLLTTRIEKGIHEYCRGNKQDLERFTYTIPGNLCTSRSKKLTLSIDLNLMKFASEAIDGALIPLRERNVTNGAVYIYNPTEKKVLAYIGSRPGSSAIDMITKRRSVGSVLKPFVYLLALRDGADNESFIMDTIKEYPTGYEEKVFVPENYIQKSYGPIRLREALGNSLNSATVRISEEVGIGKIYDFFRTIGLDMEHDAGYYGYGISIGTVELTLENIIHAYSYLLSKKDKNIFLIEQALKNRTNRSKTFGISSILNTSIPLPVKTGTSTDFRDNWVISYHPNAIIGVWVGNNNASPMGDVSGVSGAGPIWHRIAEHMITHRMIYPIENKIPEGIYETPICLDSRCFRKELQYSKKTISPKSRTLENLYYQEDFYTPLTEEEMYEWNIHP